jgi:hypothetical protein
MVCRHTGTNLSITIKYSDQATLATMLVVNWLYSLSRFMLRGRTATHLMSALQGSEAP